MCGFNCVYHDLLLMLRILIMKKNLHLHLNSNYYYYYYQMCNSNCAFTPQAARASKWPEVIHFQCEPAASSGESGAASFGR